MPGTRCGFLASALTILAALLIAASTGGNGIRYEILPLGATSMEFAPLPAGEFLMGCSEGDSECDPAEKPAHRVRITRAFQIGKYEVTQAQWEAVMGSNPSRFKGPDLPVENVLWDDTQAFLARLNARNDRYLYRLPTEAEWEYAARAGSREKNTGPPDEVAWYEDNSGKQTHPVGQKRANAWGLHDMQGNVREWCSDWYDRTYYVRSPQDDPPGAPPLPDVAMSRVLRGGCFGYSARHICLSSRGGWLMDWTSTIVGFRCVRQVR